MKLNTNFIIPVAVLSIALLAFGATKLLTYWLTDDTELAAVALIESRYPSPPLAQESASLFREILSLVTKVENGNTLPLGESSYTITNKDIDPEDGPEVALKNAIAKKYGFTFEPDPEEPLYLFQEDASFEELVSLARDQQPLIESFWSPIADNKMLLDKLDGYEFIDDYYELDFSDESEPHEDAMKLMRFHLYKAYLLVAQDRANEALRLLTRLMSILRKIHWNARSIVSEMVVTSSEIHILKNISLIAANTKVDRDIMIQAYEAGLPKLDPVNNLERILLHEALITHQLLSVAVEESRMSFTSMLVLPIHTSNLLTEHYQAVTALYQMGDYEGVTAMENRLVERIQGFGIRNYYGKIVLRHSILMVSKVAPEILESESKLDEHRELLERQLN